MPWHIRQQEFDSFWLKNKLQHCTTPHTRQICLPPTTSRSLKVKLNLKGARFDTTEEVQKAVTNQLNKIPSEDFSNAMKKLETHSNLRITSNGSYFL